MPYMEEVGADGWVKKHWSFAQENAVRVSKLEVSTDLFVT